MTLSTLVAPATLTEAVLAAVGTGAWSPAEILVAVADQHADRCDVIATLWDLVDAGLLDFVADFSYPAFRLAR
ncbi:hypothetical protein [Nocardioides sp.]|uniref:hypothetical protein n=1 Tax=Nocardioides sp. TaxID=35761 RepID=UPI00260AF746|nr:hypothetical protein [Nocardioides sp.]MDI6908473.1 hypothetical protein [Nocardioides sp.]